MRRRGNEPVSHFRKLPPQFPTVTDRVPFCYVIPMATEDRSADRTTLPELARLFAWLGLTSFGGPAAHIAMLREEVVVRRAWLADARFLDLLGVVNLLPGPNSTELAMHVGKERRGLPGLVVAGVAFIVPAMLLTGALAWVYVRYAALPSCGAVMAGLAPVIAAIVAHAFASLAPTAAPTHTLRALGLVSLALVACRVHELAVLVIAGLLHVAFAPRSRGHAAAIVAAASTASTRSAHASTAATTLAGGVAAGAAVATPSGLFLVFAKIGSVLYGSGYVLLAFLRAELVERLRWIDERQLLDAVAAGQVTPGPVFTTATFVGYVVGGPAGALAATVGIFLPAFVFVGVSGPIVRRLRATPHASAFLDGVNVASLAMMAHVLGALAGAALATPMHGLLFAGALAALVTRRAGATPLLALGAVCGLLAR
jgi:chromate transporter